MVFVQPQFGTIDIGQVDIPKKKRGREECEAKGGTWDEKTQTCLVVKKEDLPKDKPTPVPTPTPEEKRRKTRF